jgi:hypothetical protein
MVLNFREKELVLFSKYILNDEPEHRIIHNEGKRKKMKVRGEAERE